MSINMWVGTMTRLLTVWLFHWSNTIVVRILTTIFVVLLIGSGYMDREEGE
jgi:hypothetical protein